ncbi:MAG: hypothetical protein M1834_004463 [Cirrosporium novae-zelandiae]|nr:MAG: hypothetical protein M1834_004463 [Cirrosporium novae-zelandiae]
MFPPSQTTSLDIEALSGICGSISIACWVVVFSPQIIENFRRNSADGLSLLFIIVWLAGDVFNILGAVLQGVLPTMVILAVYYTFADIVLLAQCFYYRGFTLSDVPKEMPKDDLEAEPGDESPLLFNDHCTMTYGHHERPSTISQRRHSASSFRERLLSVDGTHLSPATPLIESQKPNQVPPAVQSLRQTSTLQAILFNTFSIILVCLAGAFGWWVSSRTSRHGHHGGNTKKEQSTLEFDLWGQIFGYFCAALYLGSRIPQILLNYRRKSTEGVSLLFFLFACIGNLTYVLSIFAYSPVCEDNYHCEPGEASSIYGQYILVNLSWILGSFGTLLLDLCIFGQFFLYRESDPDDSDYEEAIVDEEANGFGTNGNGEASR